MDKIEEFTSYFKEKLYIGDELGDEPAVAHYAEMCNTITQLMGESSPYMLIPLRLQIYHLEEMQRFAEALAVANKYREVVAHHVYMERAAICACDVIIGRLLCSMGRTKEGGDMARQAKEKASEIFR